MIRGIFLCIAICSSTAYTAEMPSFEKIVLEQVSKHFSLEAPLTQNYLQDDASSYLTTANAVFEKVSSQIYEAFPEFKTLEVGFLDKAGIYSYRQENPTLSQQVSVYIREDGSLEISLHSDDRYQHKQVHKDGEFHKGYVDNIYDLNTALKCKQWFALRNCIKKIAVAAHQVLMTSGDDEKIEFAKKYAVNPNIRSDLRLNLLNAMAQNSEEDLNTWLLEQKDFQGDGKYFMIEKLIQRELKANNPVKAENILQELDDRHCGYHDLTAKIFAYYFDRGNLESAESILKRFFKSHFPQEIRDKEILAEKVFTSHLLQNGAEVAEAFLQRAFLNGGEMRRTLAKKLVEVLLEKSMFPRAIQVAEKNMDNWRNDYFETIILILRQENDALKKELKKQNCTENGNVL